MELDIRRYDHVYTINPNIHWNVWGFFAETDPLGADLGTLEWSGWN